MVTMRFMSAFYFAFLFCSILWENGAARSPLRDNWSGQPRNDQRAGKEVSCGTHQLDPSTSGYTINSPYVQVGLKPTGYECTWRFLGTSGCIPVTDCDTFKLGQSNECGQDYLELGDGSGATEKFCGSNAPNVSSTNSVLIAFLKLGLFGRDRSVKCNVFCASSEMEVNNVLPTQEPERTECKCGEPGPVDDSYTYGHRIVNGEPAPKGYWRWQIGMYFRNQKSPFCGGSLINDRFVLTAAHCVVTTGIVTFPSAAEVVLNDYNFSDPNESQRIKRNIVAISSHPFYNPNTQDYDVAVLELDKPIDMLASEEPIVRPVCLPARNNLDTYEGQNATVTGWGVTTEGGDQSDILMEVQVPVISNEECNQQYDGKITNRMICGAYPEGGKDACQGDSGGPYQTMEANGRWTEIGVVSWGEGCAREGKPGVYARVTDINDWIRMTSRRGTWCEED